MGFHKTKKKRKKEEENKEKRDKVALLKTMLKNRGNEQMTMIEESFETPSISSSSLPLSLFLALLLRSE